MSKALLHGKTGYCIHSLHRCADTVLHSKGSQAVKAGECVSSLEDKEKHDDLYWEYRACKQLKQRKYFKKCVEDIKIAYHTNRRDMWGVISRFTNSHLNVNGPADDEFYDYFMNLCIPQSAEYFNEEYENIEFLRQYENSNDSFPINGSAVEEIVNGNFTVEEIERAMKTNKSPGNDCIPAEFIKVCKCILSRTIATVFNYMIEQKDFPDAWSGGICSALFKSGKRNIVDNFRGITILPIMEKVFEAVVYRRLAFVNEAFAAHDRYNNAFSEGNRTSDNLFVLTGLVEKQLTINKCLYVCYIDFSKAFDMVNRTILFYKLISSGWRGRVIDTFRSLYSKTNFQVKRNGRLSQAVPNNLGVNQGGISSGLMFCKYMSDLSTYLSAEVGIAISNKIIAHILWGDDLILFSDTPTGLQKQLNGLLKFCSNNKFIVHELKTKSMCFGTDENLNVFFNGKPIKQVNQYKYLGVIVRSINKVGQDMYSNNYRFISDKSRRAVFSMKWKLKFIQSLPPSILFDMFDTIIRPILTYGSDVWGLSKTGTDVLDKVFLNFARCTLSVKATTCNTIVYMVNAEGTHSVCFVISMSYVIYIDCWPCRVKKLSNRYFIH